MDFSATVFGISTKVLSFTEDCTLPEVLLSAVTSQQVDSDNGFSTGFLDFSAFLCAEETPNHEHDIPQPVDTRSAESFVTNDPEPDPFDDFTNFLLEGSDAFDRGCLAIVDALETGVGEPLRHLIGAQDAAPHEADGDSMEFQLISRMPELMQEGRDIVIGDAPLPVTVSEDPSSTPVAVLTKGCNANVLEVRTESDGEVRAHISFAELNGATDGWISTKFNGLTLVAEATRVSHDEPKKLEPFSLDVTSRTRDIVAMESDSTIQDDGVPLTRKTRSPDSFIVVSTMLFIDFVLLASTMLLIIVMWSPMLTSRPEYWNSIGAESRSDM